MGSGRGQSGRAPPPRAPARRRPAQWRAARGVWGGRGQARRGLRCLPGRARAPRPASAPSRPQPRPALPDRARAAAAGPGPRLGAPRPLPRPASIGGGPPGGRGGVVAPGQGSLWAPPPAARGGAARPGEGGARLLGGVPWGVCPASPAAAGPTRAGAPGWAAPRVPSPPGPPACPRAPQGRPPGGPCRLPLPSFCGFVFICFLLPTPSLSPPGRLRTHPRWRRGERAAGQRRFAAIIPPRGLGPWSTGLPWEIQQDKPLSPPLELRSGEGDTGGSIPAWRRRGGLSVWPGL